jgi:GNAT superfamily N-acetyltransferase
MTTTEVIVPADLTGHDALTADGHIVRIRPATPGDQTVLRGLYEQASDRNLYLRFFSYGRGQVEQEVRRLVRPPAPDHLTLVAVVGDALVGVASYERSGTAPDAEFAVLVADAAHGRGIGTLLIEDMCRRARCHGIQELRGEVLIHNASMLRVARDLTPGLASHLEAGVADVRIPTSSDEAALAAVDLRERHAERQALRALLAPASVAVVGAGRKPGGVGHEVLTNVVEHGYTGTVYPVNPHASGDSGARAVWHTTGAATPTHRRER